MKAEFNFTYTYNSTIKSEELKNVFFEKYKCELTDHILENFIRDFEPSNKSSIKLQDGLIQITPSITSINEFFLSILKNKSYGDIIEPKKIFFEKFKCDLTDTFIIYFNSFYKKNSKFLKKLDNQRFQIIPTDEEINNFFLSVLNNKSYGDIIEPINIFFDKFKCDLPDNFSKIYNPDFSNYHKCLKKLDNQRFQIIPTDDEINTFLIVEFKNFRPSFNLKEIKTKFKSIFKFDLSNDILNTFIQDFYKAKKSRYNIKLTNEQILIEPNYILTSEFLSSKFDKNIGSIIKKREIYTDFKNKYFCDLNKGTVENFLYHYTKDKKTIKQIEDIYIILPNDDSLLKIFDEKIEVWKINNNSSFNQEFLKNLNFCLNKLGKQLTKTSNNDGYILSLCPDNKIGLATLIQRYFLVKKVDFYCSITELIKTLEETYSINNLETKDIIQAIDIANMNLKDIKIERKDNILSKALKSNEKKIDYNKCPVCGESFFKCSPLEIQTHILELHTSTNLDNSTLVKIHNSIFQCNHCGKREALYDYRRIYHHLYGKCVDEKPHTNSPTIVIGENLNDTIWKGAGFANKDYLLGNSGQIFRDYNGQFGSHPMEDYYGDGDW